MKASQHPEAAFLAAMTASATHEVRNVLAIIKESAGLIEDMVHVYGKKGTLDREKVYRAVDRIDVQVKRGADLLTNLNRLSHTLDSEEARVDLGHEVEQAVFLSQRFARKKGHRVVAAPSDTSQMVTVHPLHLHMALFSAMECCMEALPDGAAITLSVGETERGPFVEYVGTTEDGTIVSGPPCGESWDCTQLWTDELGAAMGRSESGFGLRILFPKKEGE
jgi:C4-dicarboxylate-specific signal transduction histidine kinase